MLNMSTVPVMVEALAANNSTSLPTLPAADQPQPAAEQPQPQIQQPAVAPEKQTISGKIIFTSK